MTAPSRARTRSFRFTLASIATLMDGAFDCAAAVEAGRRPSERSLRAIGISSREWDRIGTR